MKPPPPLDLPVRTLAPDRRPVRRQGTGAKLTWKRRLSPRWPASVGVSFFFHAAFVLVVVLAVFGSRAQNSRTSVRHGSPDAPDPGVTLSYLHQPITARPAVPPPRTAPPTPAPTPPREGVPVLAWVAPVHPPAPHFPKPLPPTSAIAPVRPRLAEHRTPASPSSPKTAAPGSPYPSSYSAGQSVFPHPTYPDEARERGVTGTVAVNIEFDGQGRVARAWVVQSSGSLLLDHHTVSFIRAYWHSPAVAGQTVSVPVRYSLQSMP